MNAKRLRQIELLRQAEQQRLDCLKSPAERNQWGQFATPAALALSLTTYACKLFGGGPIRFLDPALGTGAFFSALSQSVPSRLIESAEGVELDPLFADAARELWGMAGLNVRRGDFTSEPAPKRRANFILTNPPYVRHHHLDPVHKQRLRERLFGSLRMKMSGLAGLYCYFLLLSHDWLDEQGLGLWLVPSEFMDVNYGSSLRHYLSERVTLLHLHRFSPHDVQFADALVSSCVVVFRKSLPPAAHLVKFSYGGGIEAPEREARLTLPALRASRKWTQLLERPSAVPADEPRLGELFDIKRGLATGANSFFILTPGQMRDWGIPRACVKPILPSPRHLGADVISALPNGDPDVEPRLYLLDCAEPEEVIRSRWPRLYDYLQKGHREGVPDSYLASHRAPWYAQERRPAAPFLCTYMGRAGRRNSAFRFLWNRSQATAHNVYLLLYPKAHLTAAIETRPALAEQVFNALQRIAPSRLVSEGRVYGGGLHKVEPRELAQAPAVEILKLIGSHARVERQRALFADTLQP